MIILISLGVSFLVLLGGVFLLAKAKKEELSSLYTYTAYTAIIVGLFMVFASICGGVCKMCHKRNSCVSSQEKCSSYGSSHCEKSGKSCRKNRCKKNESNGAFCSMDGKKHEIVKKVVTISDEGTENIGIEATVE